MNADRPLSGKRIVVTRSLEQAHDLKDRLEGLGATVLLLPAVSFSEIAGTPEIDRVIRSIETYDWVLFTSANAVRFFASLCRKAGVDLGDSRKPRFAAVGPATATVVAAEGFTVAYVAKEFLGTALAQELSAALAGKRVLLPRSDRAGRALPEALKSVGAEVTEIVTYHTGGIGAVEPGTLEALREARVDVVSFFSPSAVENLCGELGPETLSRLGTRSALAAVGPVTAAALRKAGFPAAIEAQLATAESMVRAIVKYFELNAASQAGSL